jgi:hypothetical protein
VGHANSEAHEMNGGHDGVYASVPLAKPWGSAGHLADVLRNLSATVAIGCAVGSMIFEEHRTDELSYRRGFTSLMGPYWREGTRLLDFGLGLFVCLVGAFQGFLTVLVVSLSVYEPCQTFCPAL